MFLLFFNQDHDHHLALYNRARVYRAMKQYDQALFDASQVVTLKSQWAKVRIIRLFLLFSFDAILSS